jgi:hypothetical protein
MPKPCPVCLPVHIAQLGYILIGDRGLLRKNVLMNRRFLSAEGGVADVGSQAAHKDSSRAGGQMIHTFRGRSIFLQKPNYLRSFSKAWRWRVDQSRQIGVVGFYRTVSC